MFNIRDGLLGNHQLTFEISEFNSLLLAVRSGLRRVTSEPRVPVQDMLVSSHGQLKAR